ncbi:MAG TPA: GNAT family N-acetyltransferase [Phenylobacterium sp.]|jgi:RimJ/RimL family protein N-acetyltransferase|nr:GNAT family N-acetyltransferase [Phenylobacterium sp.]
MIETERLILRDWRDEDREPYAELFCDPRVGEWLGGPFTRAETDERFAANRASLAETGFGRLAVERRSDGRLIGHCGLAWIAGRSPVPEGLEIAWSLAPDAWGSGFATEAAGAVLAEAFVRRRAHEVLAFTAQTNLRSQAVMRRLDMRHDPVRDFDHPQLASDHPLKRHVVFVADRPAQ